MKGLVHIYCGDGKGKTVMATGSAVCAVGRGTRVLIARFLKTDDPGEVSALAHVSGITLLPCDRNFGFSWEMIPTQKQVASTYYQDSSYKTWEVAVGQDGEGGFDVLALDEITGACNLGFADEDLVSNPIRHRPEHMETILTGRGLSEHMEKCSDYIMEMVVCRHPFGQGVGTREGIEY